MYIYMNTNLCVICQTLHQKLKEKSRLYSCATTLLIID